MMGSEGYSVEQIADAIGGKVFGVPQGRIHHLSIDSRNNSFAEGTLFFALKGDRHDGHRYLDDVWKKGVRHAVISDPSLTPRNDGAFILVKDPLDALQRLAGWHRSHFRFQVIGITGSNGKTVVKEWLHQMLRSRMKIARSPGSWNSQVGVPLSVWAMNAQHELGIFEAGISRPDEMERLRSVIRPTIGIITNVGPAHGENFKNDKEKAQEKLKLFEGAETLILCADHAAISEAIVQNGLDQRVKLRGWSRDRNGWLHVVREERTSDRTHISVLNDQVEFTYDISFTDEASIENSLHCVTLLLHLGFDPEWIKAGTSQLAPVAMRLEVLEGSHGMKLINDAYSNDLASLGIALHHLNVVGAGTKKVVVLTGMLESGLSEEALVKRIADLLHGSAVDRVLVVGDGALHSLNGTFRVQRFADAPSLLKAIDPTEFSGATVLVKGARTFHLEQVVQQWQRKVHGTVLEIDLEAIRHNLNHYRSKLRPGVKVMAMVKAFGYGSGAVELARLFAHEQVHYLGVAYADEGIDLRRQGIQLPILVMNPEPVPFRVMRDHRLEAEVYDLRSLKEAVSFTRDLQDQLPIHLKLDTGMHRLGFEMHEIPAMLEVLREAPWLKVASIFSHLVASGTKKHDRFTSQQIEQFTTMSEAIIAVLGYRPLLHIANSSAIERFPEAQLGMVRLGIGLHGIGADPKETAQLIHATSLRTPIAQVKQVKKGDTVGYERSYKASRDMRIATLPIGYADGFLRRLSNGTGRVWINGMVCPVVGYVCMDMCMVDVSGLDVQMGDEAYIFNKEHPVTELAEALGTIPYEVLTSISQRVKRIHVHT
jgi:alanine racemase